MINVTATCHTTIRFPFSGGAIMIADLLVASWLWEIDDNLLLFGST